MVLGSQCKAVDLSYPLNDTTIFWPGGEKFNLCMYSTIEPTYGYHYAAGTFSCAEHGGTHVDAPCHFAKDGKTVDMISLNDLIAPCRTIDITAHCSNNADYVLTSPDILSHEHEYGRIEEGSIILVRTGWSRFWKSGPKQYLGFDEAVEGPFTAESRLQFPGIGLDAAQLMIERKISAVGLDTGKLHLLTFTTSRNKLSPCFCYQSPQSFS